jgi:hypothetical protein
MGLPIIDEIVTILTQAPGRIWEVLPVPLKMIAATAIFMGAGATIINAFLFIWNLLVVNLVNLANGCATNAAICMKPATGLWIFGINFADYWIVIGIIFFSVLITFAIKWYSLMLPK